MTKKKTSHGASHEHKKEHTKQPTQQWNPTVVVLGAVVVILLIYIVWSDFAPESGAANVDTSTGTNTADTAQLEDTIVIQKYSDFDCPFCARAAPTVKQLRDKYGDGVVVEYKHFPLSIHPNAPKAAEASECARDQGKFWEYHDVLFQNVGSLSVSNLKKFAGDIGLDTQQFNECLDSGVKASIVDADFAEGQQKGVTGTPTFFIGDQKIVGAQPLSAFESAIANMGANVEAIPSDDPEITLTVIEDPSCTTCDSSRIINTLEQNYLPTLNVVKQDLSESQDLIDLHDIKAVPAFIFESEITQAGSYAQLSQVLVPSQGKYLISAGAVGEVKLLEDPFIENRPIRGDPNAPVLIVEYSDFECPFCAKFYTDTYAQIVDTYVESGDVAFVYKHFPLGFHQLAVPAAEASECAFEQGKFWEYHDIIFENQPSLSESNLKVWAEEIGLDMAQFNECYDSGKYADVVQQDFAQGQADGVSGTPGFIVNGVLVSGAQPFANFKTIIDAQLE